MDSELGLWWGPALQNLSFNASFYGDHAPPSAAAPAASFSSPFQNVHLLSTFGLRLPLMPTGAYSPLHQNPHNSANTCYTGCPIPGNSDKSDRSNADRQSIYPLHR